MRVRTLLWGKHHHEQKVKGALATIVGLGYERQELSGDLLSRSLQRNKRLRFRCGEPKQQRYCMDVNVQDQLCPMHTSTKPRGLRSQLW